MTPVHIRDSDGTIVLAEGIALAADLDEEAVRRRSGGEGSGEPFVYLRKVDGFRTYGSGPFPAGPAPVTYEVEGHVQFYHERPFLVVLRTAPVDPPPETSRFASEVVSASKRFNERLARESLGLPSESTQRGPVHVPESAPEDLSALGGEVRWDRPWGHVRSVYEARHSGHSGDWDTFAHGAWLEVLYGDERPQRTLEEILGRRR